MLKCRIIPIVLLDGYSVVKTINFDTRRNLGNPITVARIYNSRNVDELVLLDIDASKFGEKIDVFTISEVASECFMPLAVGGGLRTCEDISEVLSRGADKVVLNTIALENPDFITEASSRFGAQCIVVSIDVKKTDDGQYSVFSHAGKKVIYPLLDWVEKVEKMGAGEIVLNSVNNDGTMLGCDFDLVKSVCSLVKIPVIAVGGVKNSDDAVNLVRNGASAIAAASIFHFTSTTPNDLKVGMAKAGIPVRI